MSNNLAILITLFRQRHIPAESSAPSNEGSFSLCWDEQDVNLMVLEEAVEKEEVLVLPVVVFGTYTRGVICDVSPVTILPSARPAS